MDLAQSLFRQVVIVVQKSDDDTMKICCDYPAELITRPAESPEESKDFIMEQVRTPWTFWLDADEFPSLDTIEYLQTFDPYTLAGYDAVSFVRVNYIDGLIIEGGQGEDHQFRLIRSDVRWNPKSQGRRIHIHPIVRNPKHLTKVIYHHRSLEKVERQTLRWNELEKQTEQACNDYLKKVKEELVYKRK
jgi:hypothetical protein